MDTFFYHLTFATRAQASAFVAQERARFPKDLFETDLTVSPRTDRPHAATVDAKSPAAGAVAPEHLQDVPGGSFQWAVDGSRLLTPKAR